ncbi:hypothetical protein EI165_16290 [Pseudoalteromonas nigrifaciens]|nr:hypothetical protein [Pseudoalteromonas nigrifaciens]
MMQKSVQHVPQFMRALAVDMKFRIIRSIEAHIIKDRVPTEYKSLAAACESQFSEKCTLITFPHNRKDVIKSNLTEKALKKFGEPSQDTLIVVGGCFSLESVEKLKKYNAVFLALSEFSWTDERHTLIKSGEPR